MKVITNVTLRVKPGAEFTPPEAAIDLPDKTAADLLARGHVRRWTPPEPEAGDEKPKSGGSVAAKSGAT